MVSLRRFFSFALAAPLSASVVACIGDAPPVASQTTSSTGGSGVGAGGGSGGSGASSASAGGGGGLPASCSNGMKDGSETDVDCGGSDCASCATGKACTAPLDCASGACTMGACAGWSKAFGGADYDVPGGEALAFGTDGSIYLVGTTLGGIDLGGAALTSPGIFVTKLDPTGAHLWSKEFVAPTATADYIGYFNGNIAVDSDDNVYVAGEYFNEIDYDGTSIKPQTASGSDAFVAKIDGSSGALVWAKAYEGPGYEWAGVVAGPNGEVFLGVAFGGATFGVGCATYDNHQTTPDGSYDFLLARLSPDNGSCVWSNAYGSTGPEGLNGLAVDSAGDLVAVGVFQNTIDLGGNTALVSAGSYDMFFMKLKGDSGATLWANRAGGGGFSDSVTTVAVDPKGDILVAGEVEGPVAFSPTITVEPSNVGFFGAKLSGANGIATWAEAFPASGLENYANVSIASDIDGNAVLAGGFQSSTISFGGPELMNQGMLGLTPPDLDVFFARLSGDAGAHLSSVAYGGIGSETALVVTNPRTGNVVLVGSFAQTLNVGSGTMTSHGDKDVFIASLGRFP